ncbi:hypothetical protein GCM10023224_15130 [Streptomonospora halophila]|uniref:Secreted protein n=1 Tax=Streptomonospora halophila TaxID=427369 RepID=A0ABP9GAG2_9ACTN
MRAAASGAAAVVSAAAPSDPALARRIHGPEGTRAPSTAVQSRGKRRLISWSTALQSHKAVAGPATSIAMPAYTV